VKFFVTCAKGTEGALRRELVELRIRAPRGDRGGVSFEGTFSEGMRVCLGSRVAVRVLLELTEFEAQDAAALYSGARAVPWREHLSATSTFAVSSHVRDTPAFRHTGFAALKVKDAIADALRDALGARPDVEPASPDVSITLHLEAGRARLYLDLSGDPLHRRGYRVAMTDAPLKETLAAAVLGLARVAPDLPFVDPMAGSGTLAIEQALRARRIAPGLHRTFGFERWPSASQRAGLESLREEARAAILPRAPASITAFDSSPAAVDAARQNARAAGVEKDVRVDRGDVRTLRLRGPAGHLCVNPPYGARLGASPAARGDARALRRAHEDEDALEELYRDMAGVFSELVGWEIAILTGNPRILDAMRRRPEISHRLWNGPIEARLLVYRF
jgi:putative N6-adenine-specific DNA methylase